MDVNYAPLVPHTRPRGSYHHGALREELLNACVRLIEVEGIGAVSLRRVAREAGVSPAAPYHHFADRAALLAAISVRGFEQLTERLRAALAGREQPRAAVVSLARAYVTFARERKGYFQLMFRPELSQPEKHPDARAAGDAAFAVLADVVAELDSPDPEALAVSLWAFAHGLAALALDGQLDHRGAELGTDADMLTARAIRLLDSMLG
ncbi:TetR/AcrR family transcriptional regulator [Actinophytocola xanthii]|uniref:TetR family transcriptional regulator n=1 Tax=Actinophytocola xanthii TaxID=1912961 RepID=A0A1Q8C5L6_9PSEU|nr:TetR/AcrR family transcriptional regulator [Actinophytocola xanthii]OLF09636.1 TetR family transcriptional regulator [Actinophytocola xanthii]